MSEGLSPEEQLSQDPDNWRAHCLDSPMLWKMSAAALAVLGFYYFVATWRCP